MRCALLLVLLALILAAATACGRERDMPERVEMPDSAAVMRALTSKPAMDSMLDTIPGGEMARGDSVAAARLLKKKM
jgi:hypothetical protein